MSRARLDSLSGLIRRVSPRSDERFPTALKSSRMTCCYQVLALIEGF